MIASTRRSDTPVPGHYLLRLVKGGPRVAAQIVHDEDGWMVMIDGKWSGPSRDPWLLPDLERIHWGGRETTPDEAAYRLAIKRYAETYTPDAPAANPKRPIDRDSVLPI